MVWSGLFSIARAQEVLVQHVGINGGHRLGFQTLERETVIDSLRVGGSLPEWLTGPLLRTGPAKFEVGARSYRHWFDGLAMLHRFSFDGSTVSYANRFVQSRAY